ncbi:MAG: 1,4-alpha-glucan branching protein GlgB [Rhodospirillales bacterium]|nr:1,4-alpha-glucan branching protein GlgB [Rhodospirillales bacterium]
MHSLGDGHPMVVRAFVPSAVSVSVVDVKSGKSVASLDRMHDAGFFAGAILDRDEWFPYRLRIEAEDGTSTDAEDAYRFPSLLSEKQATALVEGNLLDSYEVLGAHPTTIDGVKGVAFAVWAPKAARVAVIGDFNDWDGRCHGMRLRHECGVWEIFVPGVEAGHFYKYEIKAAPGVHPFEKSDPYAFQAERWPGSASTVCDLTTYRWRDRKWMAGRKEFASREAPLAIYEVHLGSWKRVPEEGNRWMTYRELAEDLPAYVKDLGFTHIEFMPISEFSFEGSWGYQPVALYAPTGRFGSPEDFCYLVDRCHQVGIGVIIGWAPTHFADEPYGLGNFDGGSLYEHPDPKQQRHPRWHTLMYDYGRPEVANFLISNSLFWLDKYHVDGLRVHGLASILYLDYDRGPGEWSRNRFGGHENLEAVDFVRRMNEAVYEKHPGAFTMAEESSGWPMVSRPTFLGGLGFGFKWNEAWLHETLRYMSRNPVHRKYYHEELTHGPTFAFQENHVIPLAHTEVVHGKGPLLARMPGNPWDKFAHLRSYYALVYTHPGKKLMFMGNEFAQGREWNHEMSLDWHLLDEWMHGGIRTLVRDLNQLYVATPALYEQDCEEDGFEWIDANDTEQSVISYLRVGRDRTGIVAVVSNFTPVVRHGYRIGVPEDGYWKEQVNTDAERYGGSNVGNAGGVEAIHEGMHGRPYALSLTLPPYSTVVLQHVGERPSEGDAEA